MSKGGDNFRDVTHLSTQQPNLMGVHMSPYTSGITGTMATQEFTTVGMADDVEIEIQAMEADMHILLQNFMMIIVNFVVVYLFSKCLPWKQN